MNIETSESNIQRLLSKPDEHTMELLFALLNQEKISKLRYLQIVPDKDVIPTKG